MESVHEMDLLDKAASISKRTNNIIEVSSCTVMDLFSCTSVPIMNTNIKGKLKIPEYQRPYVWQEKQLKKLIVNLNEFFNNYEANTPLYYLGSIILHNDGEQLNIIDGQQRITTLALLDYFFNNKQHTLEYSSPTSITQIKANHLLLQQGEFQLDRLDLSLLNITLVITDNEDDAYTFFETQNTGGKRLSGSDIVKAHHLRAVNGKYAIAEKARKWEQKDINSINEIVGLLTKSRYWNFLQWKSYPSFRNEKAIKEAVVEGFTERTLSLVHPISFYQTEVIENNFQSTSNNTSSLKALRQPLYNGSHFIDYLAEYVDVYEELFIKDDNYRIDERFYKFRDKLMTGHNGTIFLKELFQLVLVAYVSKFGLKDIYEFSLWSFRCVYSPRVINRRTVREDSIEKFMREELLLDKILNSFTHNEVITQLKQYKYNFNNENCEHNRVKGRYIAGLGNYFSDFSQGIVVSKYDTVLKKSIYDKLK